MAKIWDKNDTVTCMIRKCSCLIYYENQSNFCNEAISLQVLQEQHSRHSNICTVVVSTTSFKFVKKQGIADRPVHIKVVFRKICPISYLIPKLFRGNLARNVLSNFAKKLTHVYFASSQYGIYTDIVTMWTIENKEGWGKKICYDQALTDASR
jgi:hypothetical protein